MTVQTQGSHLIELRDGETTITYAPSAPDGPARLDYAGPMGRHSFDGDEIRAIPSARGLEVSVTLDGVSHLRTITLTVFVPDIAFDEVADERSFRTVGIHATRRRGITGDRDGGMVSEPLEFDGFARNLALHAAGPVLL